MLHQRAERAERGPEGRELSKLEVEDISIEG